MAVDKSRASKFAVDFDLLEKKLFPRQCCWYNSTDKSNMQRAFSILPRLQPILTPARSATWTSLRWASSTAAPTAMPSVTTMPLSFATPGKC